MDPLNAEGRGGFHVGESSQTASEIKWSGGLKEVFQQPTKATDDRVSVSRQGIRSIAWLLVHIEIDFGRNAIFLRKPTPGSENFNLTELVCREWESTNHVL